MLSIGKLGIGQERYYLDKVAEGAEDYYSGEGEVAGEWVGDAARDLGLGGEVGEDQLTAILTGRSPVDGEPLVGMQGVRAKGAVPGFDLTFSAPKSVSLLWGLGGAAAANEVSAAHREAVEAALAYMQREACWTRRGAGGREFVKGDGYLAAAYVHRSSRNGDPQLHTHVLVANATRGPDGRWTRLYHPAVYEHATTASYIYEAHLRHELTRRLEVGWRPPRKGIAEIDGFSEEHLRAFSTRRAEILAAAGPDASAQSLQVATLATRRPKERDLSRGELLERWRARAQEIGLDRATIEQTFGPDVRLAFEDPERAWEADGQRIGRALTESASHFDRRDAIQALAHSCAQGAPGPQLERMADAYLASESVIRVAEGAKGPRYTTRRIWELEREALAAVERMRKSGSTSGGSTSAGEVAAARVIHDRPTLKADQREMVSRLLAGPEGVAVVIGEAGSGKTFAIAAAAQGWAQAGIPLRAAAPTWRAANALRDEGLPATSVASLLSALDRARDPEDGALERGSVLLVDEAAMVDSATLARLVSHAERAEAKLVLIGDPEQLQEIEAGGLFRAIAERSEPIHLEEVIRHEHQLDREAARRLREGEGREALDLYRSAERVTIAPDAEARREAMVRDWREPFEAGEDAVMIAKRNAEARRLNAMARELRRQEGRLGAEEIEIGEARFAAGDRVITRVNDRAADICNRERWRVTEVDPEQRRVLLEGIDQPRAVEVGATYLARTNPHSEAPALEHAYAVTTYSAQGSTVDRAYVMADPSMDKQELYVAASRARGETHLYATPEVQAERRLVREEFAPSSPHRREGIPHIAEAAVRDRAKRAAHDIAELEALPSGELIERRERLLPQTRREREREQAVARLGERIEKQRQRLAELDEQMERVGELPRRRRRRERELIEDRAIRVERGLGELEAQAHRLAPVERLARRELASTEAVLDGRVQAAVLAARLSPPPYITRELGERPRDRSKQWAWDRGVEGIETYRQRHGVKDPNRALGREQKRTRERELQRETLRRVQEMQRVLGLGRFRSRERELGRSLGLGR
jgi:conjugative relaxase-like TrwC/TraI family protein